MYIKNEFYFFSLLVLHKTFMAGMWFIFIATSFIFNIRNRVAYKNKKNYSEKIIRNYFICKCVAFPATWNITYNISNSC